MYVLHGTKYNTLDIIGVYIEPDDKYNDYHLCTNISDNFNETVPEENQIYFYTYLILFKENCSRMLK